MALYTLQINALGSFSGGNAPLLEVLVDGAVFDSRSMTGVGSNYSFNFDFTGNFPSSISFRFLSSSGDPGDTITINSATVNGSNIFGGNNANNVNALLLQRGQESFDLSGRFVPDQTDLGTPSGTGTGGDDNLVGSDVVDNVIDSGAGADRVTGRNGDDAINGGDGNDRLFGEGGDDLIIGGAGDDRIWGHAGNDQLFGEDGVDRIIGGAGDDVINGGLGNDILIADAGNDTVFGEDGNDRLIGKDGNDVLFGDAGNDILNGGNDDDTIFGGDDDDRIIGGNGNDSLDGGNGNDLIYGNDGNDTIDGEAGIDTIYSGAGSDLISGGDNDDTIFAGDDSDTVFGGNGDDTIDGENGVDIINGGANNDLILGGDGGDTLNGDAGNDTIFAYVDTTSGTFLSQVILNDNPIAYWRLNEGAGTTADNLGSLGSTVDGTYSGGVTLGSTGLYGSGDVTADFGGVNGIVNIPDSASINLSSVTERTIEMVFRADDVVSQQVLYEEGGTVNSLAIYIEGNNIYFEGVDSGDWGPFSISSAITTGETYHIALVLDQPGGELRGYVDGVLVGTGAVTVPLSAHSGNIYIGGTGDGAVYHDGADGTAGYHFDGKISDVAIYNDVLSLTDIQERSDLANSSIVPPPLVGDDGADILNGGAGDDTLYAYGAGDTLNGDADNDILYGTDDVNTLNGGSGDDEIYGEDAADIIDGGADNDTIRGGEGDDTIQGGAGDDIIYGDDISSIVMETGRESVTQLNSTQWHSVSFSSTISNAVVKMFAEDVTGDPFTLRVRDITETGFEFQLDEYDY